MKGRGEECCRGREQHMWKNESGSGCVSMRNCKKSATEDDRE